MSKFVVQLCFWNPVLVEVAVEAAGVEEACERAFEADPWDHSWTCYDAATETKVCAVARGSTLRRDLPDQLRVPARFRDPIMSGYHDMVERAARAVVEGHRAGDSGPAVRRLAKLLGESVARPPDRATEAEQAALRG